MDTLERGRTGEALSRKYLREKGYEIIAQNYRTRRGEIDIIARKDGVVCFCEVKARSRADYGSAGEFVIASKQHKLSLTALDFMQKNGLMDTVTRFDVIEVYFMDDKKIRINHIEHAFDCCALRL